MILWPRSVCCDHSSVKVDVWRCEMIEDGTGVIEVSEGDSTESDELEGINVRLPVALG